MKLIKSVVLTALVFASGGVLADERQAIHSHPTEDNRHIEYAFSVGEIYDVKGAIGVNTAIEFGANESILTTAIGDSKAWAVASPCKALIESGGECPLNNNRLFAKPITKRAPSTNLTVVTNRGTYVFDLAIVAQDKAYMLVNFDYPPVENEVQIWERRVSELQQKEQVSPKSSSWNAEYSYKGDVELLPSSIYDDGLFTYIKFSRPYNKVPAAFDVDIDTGDEAILNFSKKGQWYVLHRVMPQITLRHGDKILCLFNEPLVRAIIDARNEGIANANLRRNESISMRTAPQTSAGDNE